MKVSTLLKIIEKQESDRFARLQIIHKLINKQYGDRRINHEQYAQKAETELKQEVNQFIKNNFNEFDMAYMQLLKTI